MPQIKGIHVCFMQENKELSNKYEMDSQKFMMNKKSSDNQILQWLNTTTELSRHIKIVGLDSNRKS